MLFLFLSIHKIDMELYANRALLGEDWAENVSLTVLNGVITSLATDVPPKPVSVRCDALLPAMANLHSHSFQYAMAGKTEQRVAGRESFWTWRDLMYRFVTRLTPAQVEAIAAMAFVEMLEAGYGAVGEFHYLHHQPGGQTYDDIAELSGSIFAAAQESGIGLTHLPVLYSYGGVNRAPLGGGQARFGNDVERFLRLVDTCDGQLRALPTDARLGIAPHSLRATAPDELATVVAARPVGPIHIHIAEQEQEVTEVAGAMGQGPVAWLLDHMDVDARWCLIHATHMTDAETTALARSGAVAGLCPITEANLGDGIFNGAGYLADRGRYGIGTDSNVQISLTGELRLLEYSQRLRRRERNVMVAGTGSTGTQLYTAAARSGAQALARNAGEIAVGKLADLVAVDTSTPALAPLPVAQLLDGLIFAENTPRITDTWSAGRHVVRQARHIAREAVERRYLMAVSDLMEQL